MPRNESAVQTLKAPLLDAIVRRRYVLWGILLGIYAFAFTGQWRVGRDSALYRGLAHSLATKGHYEFGVFGSQQVYPGLPVMLAGLEKVFGLAAWPGIVIMHAMAAGCLVFTYKLLRLRFPQWLAVIVTFGVGINGWFLELTNELLTDIPFLLGLVIALYGWERLRIMMLDEPRERRRILKPLIYLFVGLALAAAMRPTFWVLAMAWILVCCWGLIAGPRRRFYAICLGILVLVWLAIALVDPRMRGFRPLQGGYEQDAINSLEKARQNITENLPQLTGIEMNFSFFGQKWWPPGMWRGGVYVPGLTDLMSMIVILAPLLLWRTNPLWPLIVLLTVAVTLVMTVVPRYYIMVLPLAMLGWFCFVSEIARRVPHRWLEVAFFIGILAVALPNFARCLKVIGQQHAWGRSGEETTPRWQYVLDMGEEVNRLVAPGEKVIAPGAPIMAYISGRECVSQRDVIPAKKTPVHYPEHLAALNIRYAVFPSLLYEKSERIIRELMDRGVIVPIERVAKKGDVVLFKVEIRVPPAGKDWRKQPITTAAIRGNTTASGTTRPSAKVIAAKKRKAAAERKILALHKAQMQARLERQKRIERQAAAERAEAKARKIRHQKRAAAAARRAAAATAPATMPGTAPATQPSSRAAPILYFDDPVDDVGGLFGQSSASRNASICSLLNRRAPKLMPWQRFPASSQFALLVSSPPQNGQVLHCSGRASYTVQTRFMPATPFEPRVFVSLRKMQS